MKQRQTHPIQVTHVEFYIFIKNYSGKLESSISMISEPPTKFYDDFSDGKIWPESTVANVTMNETYPLNGTYPWIWSPNKYYIYK